MRETDTSLLESKCPELLRAFAAEILSVEDYRGDLSVIVKPDRIRDVIRHLKEAASFEMMLDLFGMDYAKFDPPHPERFAVVYQLYSLTRGRRIRVKAYLPEDRPEIDSIHEVYRAANWFEREAWDLFGIRFRGHPNLKRILCHHEFEGHPLRKDYPSDGYQRLKQALPPSEM